MLSKISYSLIKDYIEKYFGLIFKIIDINPKSQIIIKDFLKKYPLNSLKVEFNVARYEKVYNNYGIEICLSVPGSEVLIVSVDCKDGMGRLEDFTVKLNFETVYLSTCTGESGSFPPYNYFKVSKDKIIMINNIYSPEKEIHKGDFSYIYLLAEKYFRKFA